MDLVTLLALFLQFAIALLTNRRRRARAVVCSALEFEEKLTEQTNDTRAIHAIALR